MKQISVVVLLAVFFGAGCSKGPSEPAQGGSGSKQGRGGGGPPGGGRGPIEFPVEAQRVRLETLQYSITAVGSVEAFERVQMTARVQGVVDRVRFRDGDQVTKDQVLVEIEPDRYRLAVQQARAMMEKADAASIDAKSSLERREGASAKNPGLIRGEEVESFRMKARTADAERLAAETALEQAQLNLRDALVRAPIAGRIQTRTVQTGQWVQPGTVLATMIRRDPLLLRFKVPERDAEPLRTGMAVTFNTRGDPRKHSAKITLVAEIAEESSRMVSVTAEVDQVDAPDVKPGAFAEVVISQGSPREVAVIPQTAIRPSERGFLAFVIEDGVAKERVLELGMRSLEGGVEVKSGINAGELLVVRGSEALREGVKVKIAEGDKARDPERAETRSP